jgi:hypothetical protein
LRLDRKARVFPSWLHLGELELKPSALNLLGVPEPSAATIQSEEFRRFFWESIVVST